MATKKTGMGAPTSLRQLRLWHYRKVVAFRKRENTELTILAECGRRQGKPVWAFSQARVNAARASAEWHLAAVRVLDKVVDGGVDVDDAQEQVA